MRGLILSLYVKGKLFKCICTGLRCQVSVFSNIHLGKVRPYTYLYFKPKSCTVRIVQIELPHSGRSHLNYQIRGLLNSISGPFPSDSKTFTDTTVRIFKTSTSGLWGSSLAAIKRELEEVPLCFVCDNDKTVIGNVFGWLQTYIFIYVKSWRVA